MNMKRLKHKILQLLPGRVGKRYERKHLLMYLHEIAAMCRADSQSFAIFVHDDIGREITLHGYFEKLLIEFLEKHHFCSIKFLKINSSYLIIKDKNEFQVSPI